MWRPTNRCHCSLGHLRSFSAELKCSGLTYILPYYDGNNAMNNDDINVQYRTSKCDPSSDECGPSVGGDPVYISVDPDKERNGEDEERDEENEGRDGEEMREKWTGNNDLCVQRRVSVRGGLHSRTITVIIEVRLNSNKSNNHETPFQEILCVERRKLKEAESCNEKA